ncbi:LamG-like jellyroll fold domain-containing protein [Prosthecobacter sp.]|uniref:LamG-like jellyroll fold domain-containing protein n=1 Tax=Prosthecobacter sp. TaxID=1965333 RepID=UPI002ABA7548|nr:LamG-like jellyroll fold domain-containing protein [Prosthecobacter sp.]MDZ4401423.1 LamG-like jellyroll fold domain-containing protein [Prosthecobacter sp.]
MSQKTFLTHFCLLILSAYSACSVGHLSAADIFDKSNLAAWCIVPFDAAKRTPEARAEMVAKMGLKKVAYDWRAEHVAEFEREILAYQKHGIEMFAFWGMHDEAFRLFEKYKLHPQIWIMMKGAGETQEAQIKSAAEGLLPILEKAKKIGSQVGIYNHGGWGGEPENMVAVCDYLKKNHAADNIGIIYNLHHGHSHLDRLPKAIEAMKPHLLCLNLNGMDIDGEAKGRKILPLGVGTEDVKVLRILRASGYSGPIGILNHTNEDAEGRLLDNLDGLKWLIPQLDDAPPAAKPKYRTWDAAKVQAAAAPAITAKLTVIGQGVPSLSKEFGDALKGSYFQLDNEPFRTLPLTIECRAKLTGKERFNILVASDAKSSATHWELYTHAKRGTLALYMPGRGGDFDSQVNVCDGEWHNLLASIDEQNVTLWIDGKQVLEKPVQPLQGTPKAGGIAFGSLVDHSIGCDGLIDDARISRGVMKPRKGDSPRLRMDNTLGLWDFDDLHALLPPPAPTPAEFKPDLPPLNKDDNQHWREFVNRERTFDYYGKQALKFMNQTLPELIPAFPGMDGGQQGHWGNQNDQVTWKDGRFAASDLGSVFSTVFKGAGLTIPKAVCVRFDDKAAVFDPETLSFPVVWSGGFVKLNDNRHGFMGGGTMDGKVESKDERKHLGSYRGFYRFGKEVIFEYVLDGQKQTSHSSKPEHFLDVFKACGPAQWPQWIETKGELGTQTPFATDRITIPFENPYGTLFFITAHDFFSDGTAAIATMTGEVWLVKGIDEKLEKVRWKRFATGLHQPLGMKVVKDKLYVLGRDQITCLHDLNGDDEADFYECITNAMTTSPGGHDFIVGLETDAQGRWYFASGNQGVCRIDVEQAFQPVQGSQARKPTLHVLATGFRNPNGLGLSPDGRFITTSVQEGDWTPATSLCQIELGKNEGSHFGAGGPKNNQPPEPVLMYMPRGEDNSASSQAFISGDKWASLKGDGNLIHLSSGGGSAWLVMRQNVQGRWQGAAVKISGNFDSGPQAARFNPNDGHLYVNGMQGWGSYTPKDGCFQRVRFTGGDKPVPIGFEARDNGVIVRFNQPVKDADATTCFAQCWNYRYSAAYGSPEYSVKYADTPGHDPLEIRSVQKLDGGKTLFLEIPQIVTASQIHLRVSTGHDIFLTAHALAEPFTDFPGYAKIAKTNHAAQIGMTAPVASKPNPWAKGEGGREIVVEAALGLQYVQKQLTAKAGEKISLVFKNPDVVPHNWMLAKPGTLQSIGNLANLMISDPQGLARHYVPESKDVLVYTDMVNSKESFTIHFTVPKEKGDYPYLCTFPGHWMVMNGVLRVSP